MIRLLELWPVKDNTTRWNSQYNAIKAAIRLRPRLRLFCDTYRDVLKADVLSEKDWEELQLIYDALEGFADVTLQIQSRADDGHHGSLWEWLPAIECLKDELEDAIQAAKELGTLEDPINIARQNAYEKLDKYWNKSDQAYTLYAAATLMCSEQRMHYFDAQWNTKHTIKYKEQMRKAVKAYWDTNYRDQTVIEERPTKRATVLDKRLNRAPSTTATGNDFDHYITGMPVSLYDRKATSLLQWWARLGPPQLRQMAYDLLSIPCTSCECERAFSSAKRTMAFDRMSLKEKTVEQCELLRNWWRQGVVQQPQTNSYIDGDEEVQDHLPDREGTSDSDWQS
jgi:hAT family protein